jgi:pimeloyl-[acyl-carrier protein] methyl ester esterase
MLKHRTLGSEIAASNTSTPLVMLHGWGLNSGVFDAVAHELAQHLPVILIDLPGFGENAAVPLTDIETVAAQIAAALPQQCHLLGWSLGGLIAQQIALTHPQRLNTLIALATSPCFMAREDWPGIQPKILTTFQSQLAHDYQTTVQRFMAIQAMGAPNAKADIQAIKQAISAYPAPCEASLQQGLVLLETVDLRQALPHIQVPTLRLYGRLDALVPVAAVALIDTLHADCHSVIMEHVSHAPFISAREAFIEQVTSFVLP